MTSKQETEEVFLQRFAHWLTCWLSPEDILTAAYRLTTEPDHSNAPSAVLLVSSVLTYTNDGGLRQLVETFLNRVSLSFDTLDLLRHLHPRIASGAAWESLYNLKVVATLETPDESVPSPDNYNPVLVVRERDYVVDLFTAPLNALVNMVAKMSQTWQLLTQRGLTSDNLYLKSSTAEPLASWLDEQVAEAHGLSGIADPNKFRGTISENIRYRAVTIVGWNGDELMNEATQNASRSQASQTLTPLPKLIR